MRLPLQHVFSLGLFHSLMRINYFLIIQVQKMKKRNFHILYSQCRSAEDKCYFFYIYLTVFYINKNNNSLKNIKSNKISNSVTKTLPPFYILKDKNILVLNFSISSKTNGQHLTCNRLCNTHWVSVQRQQ